MIFYIEISGLDNEETESEAIFEDRDAKFETLARVADPAQNLGVQL